MDNGAILLMLRLISMKEKSMETSVDNCWGHEVGGLNKAAGLVVVFDHIGPHLLSDEPFSQTPMNVTNPHDRTKPQLSQAEALFCVYSMKRKRGCVGILTHPLITIRD